MFITKVSSELSQ